MKKYMLLFSLCAPLLLTSCTHFSEEDRAMIRETHYLSVQANEKANRAIAEAAAARQEAATAAAAALRASERAERIFEQGSNK